MESTEEKELFCDTPEMTHSAEPGRARTLSPPLPSSADAAICGATAAATAVAAAVLLCQVPLRAPQQVEEPRGAGEDSGEELEDEEEEDEEDEEEEEVKGRGMAGKKLFTPAKPSWCQQEYTHPNRYVRLHQEIYDLYQYVRPTREEMVMRKRAVEDMRTIVAELWPGSTIMDFGSAVTGLELSTSDANCSVVHPDLDALPEGGARTARMHCMMDSLARYVVAKGICTGTAPEVVKATRVPVVRFVHRGTHVDVDVAFGALDWCRSSEWTAGVLRRLPVAAPLIVVVKHFLKQRGMNDPIAGGLGSYAIALMVAVFLETHPAFVPGGDPQAAGMGGLLLDFFRTYGWLVDYQTVALRAADGRFIRKEPRHYTRDRGALWCEDPTQPGVNAAAAATRMFAVRNAFSHAFHALASDKLYAPPNAPTKDGGAEEPCIALRPTLLSRVFHTDRALRARRAAVRLAYDRRFQNATAAGTASAGRIGRS